MSNSPNSRLKDFIERLDDTFEKIGDKTGFSRRTWQRLVEEGASIKSEYLLALHDIYGADINYILTGKPSVPTWGSSKSVQTSEHPKHVPTWEKSEDVPTWANQVNEDQVMYDPSEFASVPYYPNVYASGGQGLIAENESTLQILFRRYFFAKTIQSSPENCFVVKLKGDSMQPMFKDGSDLLIDSSRQKIKEGPAFMVRIEDDHYCKLLAKLPDGTIRMSSVNQAYQPIIGDPKKDDFEIIGEVVWDAHVSPYI